MNPAEASVVSWCVSEVAGRPSTPPIFVGDDSPAATAASTELYAAVSRMRGSSCTTRRASSNSGMDGRSTFRVSQPPSYAGSSGTCGSGTSSR